MHNIAPAPHLTKLDRCSGCNVHAIEAADGDMKVCPVCFAVLWHRDYAAEDYARRAIERREAHARGQIKKAQRQQQREARIQQQLKAETAIKPQ